jgi:GT2 family glycosyltransferase
MHDLAVVVVSTNDRPWLGPCLRTVFRRAGDLDLDVVVADNESTDGTAELIRDDFPSARVVRCSNRGFGHANNRAVMTCEARYFLFLNPDTEIMDGTLEELVRTLDGRPEIGLAGVRQVTADGVLYPTIRRFPNVLTAFGEAFGTGRFPQSPGWLRERVLDEKVYGEEVACDWMTGSFMVCRKEALLGAGLFDERFFMSSEETDLAYRIKQGGWHVVHLPQLTILHHVHMGKPLGARMEAQYAFARRQYAAKHFSRAHTAAYLSMVRTRYRARFVLSLLPGVRGEARINAGAAPRALRRAEPPPFGVPPVAAVAAADVLPRRSASSIGTGMPNQRHATGRPISA